MKNNSHNKQKSIKKKDYRHRIFKEKLEILLDKKNLNFDIKKGLSKSKSMGFYPTIVRKILSLRKMDINERYEQETLLNTYENALGIYY